MKKTLVKKLALLIAVGLTAPTIFAAPDTRPAEAPTLRKQDYRVPIEEVIVIGQTPYWRKEGQPRWDRSKVEVDLKPAKEPRLQVFPNYTAEERDEAMKPRESDRNISQPKIKLFDVKF